MKKAGNKELNENESLDSVFQRIEELKTGVSTHEQFFKISSTGMRKIVAKTSILCEEEASKLVTDIQYVNNIEELKNVVIFKGEEEINVPKLPILEMKVIDSKTKQNESVRYGLKAILTNHRLIFLDITSTSHPLLNIEKMNNASLYPSEIEVSHNISASLSYYPISLSEILGIMCDFSSGIRTSSKIHETPLFPVTIIFLLLSIVLSATINWWLMFFLIPGLPFLFVRLPRKSNIESIPTQKKQLKLAVINPETKNLSLLILEIPEKYLVQDILTWIREIQGRSPLLHEEVEMRKNININLS
ncbi:MAG: hypothetical protein ACTSSG_10565 [Candidatus Heimdallarchaeaceae archaeon]